jgi:hypothetical protein
MEVVAAEPRRVLEALGARLGYDRVQLFGDRVHLRLDAEPAAGVVDDWLRTAGLGATAIRRIVPTLEDVFIERLTAATPPGGGRTSR